MKPPQPQRSLDLLRFVRGTRVRAALEPAVYAVVGLALGLIWRGTAGRSTALAGLPWTWSVSVAGGIAFALAVGGSLRWHSDRLARLAPGLLVLAIAGQPTGGHVAEPSRPRTAAALPQGADRDEAGTASAIEDLDDLRFRVLGTRIVWSEESGTYLEVELSITNTHPTSKLDDFEFFAHRVEITDNYGNRYPRIRRTSNSRDVVAQPLYPCETVVVLLRFEPPVRLAQSLSMMVRTKGRDSKPHDLAFRIDMKDVATPRTGRGGPSRREDLDLERSRSRTPDRHTTPEAIARASAEDSTLAP